MIQSEYLKFWADKLAYMSGCEAGPDPVNSPEEVYKRYGGDDEPYEKVSSYMFPDKISSYTVADAAVSDDPKVRRAAGRILKGSPNAYGMEVSAARKKFRRNAVNGALTGGAALAIPAGLIAGPVGAVVAAPIGAKMGYNIGTTNIDRRGNMMSGATPYSMMALGAGGAYTGSKLGRHYHEKLGLSPDDAATLGGTAGLLSGVVGGYFLGRHFSD